jgi:hypothetical protein
VKIAYYVTDSLTLKVLTRRLMLFPSQEMIAKGRQKYYLQKYHQKIINTKFLQTRCLMEVCLQW